MNGNVFARFRSLLRSGRLAHAYLFVGPDGVGKTDAALLISRWINCEENRDGARDEPCGCCSSCLKVNSGNHPDVTVIDSGETQTIKIEQVREVIQRSQLRPFEGRKKIYIIKKAEELTSDAGNAFLKTLEEPSADSLLILTTAFPERILATIRSRCHAVCFSPLSKAGLATRLKKDYSMISEEAAHFLAYFTQGCLGRARQLREEELFERKNEIIDRFQFAGQDDNYLKSLSGDRARTKEALTVLLTWIRDVLLVKSGAPQNQLVHRDRLADLSRIEGRYSIAELNEIVDEITHTFNQLQENLNVRVPLTLLKERIHG